MAYPSFSSASRDPNIFDELARLRDAIKNDVIHDLRENLNFEKFVPPSRSTGQLATCHAEPVKTIVITEGLQIAEDGVANQEKVRDHQEPITQALISPRTSGGRVTRGQVKNFFPTSGILLVEIPDGRSKTIDAFDLPALHHAFEAKWKLLQMPPIAAKLNMPLAIQLLRGPCVEAFKKKCAKRFVLPIGYYLFDMGVLRTAFLPGILSEFHAKSRNAFNENKRILNSESQQAFFFLVDYFSTMVVNKDTSHHSLWQAVVRNCFNTMVNLIIKGNRPGLNNANGNILGDIFSGHVPIFNCDNAF